MDKFTDQEAVIKFIKNNKIHRFKIGVVDFNGILRSKYLAKAKFLSGLKSGLALCDAVLGIDVNDHTIDGLHSTGWHTGYPDAPLQIVCESGCMMPNEPGTMFFLCEFAGEAETVCPRHILKKVVNKAKDMGFVPYSAFEYEFSVFNETVESVREKEYQNLEPLSPDNFGYSFLRNSMFADYYHDIMDVCESMGVPIEGIHTEIGPGILEAAIAYSDSLQSADRAVVFKNMLKIISHNRGLIASFMAKCDTKHQGHSGHIHISLRDEKDNPVFYQQDAPNNMSDVMRSFVAGQMKYMPELLALVAATVNDYARLVPDYWAPTQVNWGLDNRTSALRVISGSPASQRVEYRVGSASSNPYLALAAALLSGLMGIDESLTLEDAIEGNAYEQQVGTQVQLPRNLRDAAQLFSASSLAKSFFGDIFVHDYAKTREWEETLYQKQVTDWQLKRYFEII